MSYIAALTNEEKALVKHIYGFAQSSYTPRFDGAKYLYELEDDASPLHFEAYVTACSDLVVSSHKQPGNRLPVLIALQVKTGLVGQPTYYLTKPVLDNWDPLLRTNIEAAQLDLFVAQIRYTLRRELRMEFWVRVFDSYHQRPEEDIKTLQAQLNIILDAFCWAKLVMIIMDGIPGVHPLMDNLKEQDRLLLQQRMLFRDYASQHSFRHLWGLIDPIDLIQPESPTSGNPSKTGPTKPADVAGTGETFVPSQTTVLVPQKEGSFVPSRFVISPSKTRQGIQFKPTGTPLIQEISGSPSTDSTDKVDSSAKPSAASSPSSAQASETEAIPTKSEGKTAEAISTGKVSATVAPSPIVIQYLSPYASIDKAVTTNLRDLATFAVAQLAEPFRMDSLLVVPQRRAVVNMKPAAYRNEVLRVCGADTKVYLHNFFGPDGTPLRHAPSQDDWVSSLGDYAAIVTDRPRNTQDWSIPPEDVRRLPFTEAFKLVVLKRAIQPRLRKLVFPKGYAMWHPTTLDAAWARLFAAEAQLKAKVTLRSSLPRSVPQTSNARPPTGVVGTTSVLAAQNKAKVPREGTPNIERKTQKPPSTPPSTREKPYIEGYRPPCRHFSRGSCSKGDACPFYHGPRKTKPSKQKVQQASASLSVQQTTPTTNPSTTSYPTPSGPTQTPATVLGLDWSQYRIVADDRAVRGFVIQVRDSESKSQTFSAPVKNTPVKTSKTIPSLDGDKVHKAFKEDPVETIAYLDSTTKNNLREAHLRTITTGDKVFRLIVDTGAEASMISAEQVRFFFSSLPVLPTKVSLVGALTQETLSVIHRICITLVISISPLAVAEHWFLVVPGLAVEFLLGMDFLTRYKCQINCDGLQVSLLVGKKPAYPVTLFRQGDPSNRKENSVVGMITHKRKDRQDGQQDSISESKEAQVARERAEVESESSPRLPTNHLSLVTSTQLTSSQSSTTTPLQIQRDIPAFFPVTSSTYAMVTMPTTMGTTTTTTDVMTQTTPSKRTRSATSGVLNLTPQKNSLEAIPSDAASPTIATPKKKSKPMPKSLTTPKTPPSDLSVRTVTTPSSQFHTPIVYPNTDMCAAAYVILYRINPSPLSPDKLRHAATSIVSRQTYQYPRFATLLRNIQAAPTQEYLQSQLYTLKDARTTAQEALKDHPMTFTHSTRGTFPASAVSPYHASRRVIGHFPVATFQHIPVVTANPPHQLNVKTLFTLVVGDPRLADLRIKELRNLVCERMRILEPLSAMPEAPALSPVQRLDLVQEESAVVAEMPCILVEEGKVKGPIPLTKVTKWPPGMIQPLGYTTQLALRLYENGKALANILQPTDLIPKFSFTQVSEWLPFSRIIDTDPSYLYLYAWIRLFEMFGLFAEEPFWYPLAFLWHIYLQKTPTGYGVVEYKLESQEHTIETFALYNLRVMHELLTPSFREAAASAMLFPSLLTELDTTASIHLRGMPEVIPLARADPHSKIQAIRPGRFRTIRFKVAYDRHWRPNTFYTLSWLPFAATYFMDVDIVNKTLFITEDPPTFVDIRFKNQLDTIVILPFRIPLVGAIPAWEKHGKMDPDSIRDPPKDDDDDDANDECKYPRFDESQDRTDLMIPSSLRLRTPTLDPSTPSGHHTQL